MKATDLMVGDQVTLFEKYPAKVECIGNTDVYLMDDDGVHWRVPYSFIKPVPITPDNLLKNGFRNGERNEVMDQYIFVDNLEQSPQTVVSYSFYKRPIQGAKSFLDCRTKSKDADAQDDAQKINILYVHELQHLLRVVGIEKEIVI